MKNIMFNLAGILAKGEGQNIEFKKSLSERKEGLKSICAFVNADSAKGIVIFGIDPDGTVCGIESGNLDTAQRSLSQAIKNKFDPTLHSEIQTPTHDNKQLVVITANRFKSVPYHEFDGRAWIRVGSENRQLTIEEKNQLRMSRDRENHTGPWKCDRCGYSVGQLNIWIASEDGMRKDFKCECGGEFWPSSLN